MITKLSLENFKKHAQLEVALGSGLNALIGENAEGKSTVLKGINYALFGVTQNGSKPHLTRRGADTHRVSLEIDLQGEPHRIERTPRSAKVFRGGDLVASGTTATSAFIEESLGMSAKDYLMLTYSPQGEPRMLLAMGATALQRKIEELSHSQVIDQVLELAGKDQRQIEAQLSVLAASEVSDLGELEAMLKKTEQEARQVETEKGSSGHRLAQLKEEKEHVRQTLNELAEKLANVKWAQDRLGAALTELDKATALQRSDRVTGADVENAEAAYQARLQVYEQSRLLEDTLQRKANERTQVMSTLAWTQSEQGRLEEKVKASREAVRMLEDCRESLGKVEQELAAHNAEYDSLTQDWRKAKESVAGAYCQTCRRPFDADEHQQAQARLDHLNHLLHEKQQLLKPLGLARDTYVAQMARHRRQIDEQAEADLRSLQSSLGILTEKLASLEPITHEQLRQAQEARVNEHRLQQAAISRHAELQNEYSRQVWVDQQVADWREKVRRLAEELQQMPPMESLTTARQQEHTRLAQLEEQHTRMEQGRIGLITRLAELSAQLHRLQAEIVQARERSQTQARLVGEQTRLARLRALLSSRRAQWINDTWDGLLRHASYWLSSISTLSEISRSDAGDFYVKENGVEVPVTELSGAQSALVGICLRLALSRVFYGKSCTLLLDEPSADCSDANAARLAGLLRGLGQQVLLVSHRGGDVQQADQVFSF